MAGSCVHYMYFHSPYNTGNFLTDWVTISFCRSTVLQMMQTVQGSKTQFENFSLKAYSILGFINLMPKIIKIAKHQKL